MLGLYFDIVDIIIFLIILPPQFSVNVCHQLTDSYLPFFCGRNMGKFPRKRSWETLIGHTHANLWMVYSIHSLEISQFQHFYSKSQHSKKCKNSGKKTEEKMLTLVNFGRLGPKISLYKSLNFQIKLKLDFCRVDFLSRVSILPPPPT